MTKRTAIRVESPPEVRERIRHAIAQEREFATETKAQAREFLNQVRAEAEAIDSLRAERERLGLSLADVEARSGMTRSAISKLENHRTKNPTLDTLRRYAAALGMRLEVSVSKAMP